jgi:hypothetical protein
MKRWYSWFVLSVALAVPALAFAANNGMLKAAAGCCPFCP